jgi:DNA-3-methyladenine glycosylase II
MKKTEIRFPSRLKGARHLAQVDQKFAALIKEVGSVTVKLDPNESVYESLGVSIIYQQLHGKAAASIAARFKKLYSKSNAFPSPKQVVNADLEQMKTAGLSESKCIALKDLAQKTLFKQIPDRKTAEDLSDEALIEAFTSVRGIGPWTAQMLLIFTLGRTDVLPTGDYGVRRGFALLYGKKKLPTPKELAAFGERWQPYRSIASWYLWRATELPRFQGITLK